MVVALLLLPDCVSFGITMVFVAEITVTHAG